MAWQPPSHSDGEGFHSRRRHHSGSVVAKDVIITLIAGTGELIGMTSFGSLGPTCSQIIKETKVDLFIASGGSTC